MVYLHFPSNMTEEEQMLQAKYQKLRKKKKALQALKAPKTEPELLVPLKRPIEAKDAKEMAKKLIKSGAIKVPERHPPATEKTTFKRSIGLERKLSAVEKAPSGYQPFSTSHPEEEVHESRIKVKELYDSFVSPRERESRSESREVRSSIPSPASSPSPASVGPLQTPSVAAATTTETSKPRQGHTIYIHGFNITEEILKKAFNSYGNIVNINMEVEKNCGFVTFDKVESAEKSITEMNGSIASGVQLKVDLARHQIVIEAMNDSTSSVPWATIAASHSQKGSHNDKRDLVIYEEDIF